MKKQLLILGIAGIALFSCSKPVDPAQAVIQSEKDIVAIGKIDLQQIIDKGDIWKYYGLAKGFVSKETLGVDLFKSKTIVVTGGVDKPNYGTLFFEIENEEVFMKKLNDYGFAESEENEGYFILNSAVIPNVLIAHNKKTGFVVASMEDKKGSSVLAKTKETIQFIKHPASKPLAKEVETLLSVRKDVSLLVYPNKVDKKKMGTTYVDMFKEGSYVSFTLNGDNGNISLQTNIEGVDLSKSETLGSLNSKGVAEKVIKEILGENTIAALGLSFKKESLVDLIKKNKELTEGDKNMLDLTRFLKNGDIGMAFTGVQSFKPSSRLVFTIADAQTVSAFLDTNKLFTKGTNGWMFIEEGDTSLYLSLKEDLLFVDLGKAEVNTSSNGGFTSENYIANPVYFNFNFEKINDQEYAFIGEEYKKVLSILSTFEFKTNVSQSELKLSFKDESKNGWLQLVKATNSLLMNNMIQ